MERTAGCCVTVLTRPAVGRESVLIKRAAELGMEVAALKEERRQIGALAPHAERVYRYVAAQGDSIEAEQLAAYVAAKLAQVARR